MTETTRVPPCGLRSRSGSSFLVRRARDDGTLGKEKERPKPPLRSHIISLLLDATAFAEGD
jgi:hypothetical protein